MPCSFAYDADARILRIRLHGAASADVFAATLDAITSAREFPPDVDTIWDFSDADFDATRSADVREMLSIRLSHPDRGGGLVAIVAPDDIAFGMSRVFQAIAESALSGRVTVVRSAEEAQSWIETARSSN